MKFKPKHQRTILWASLMIAINSIVGQQVQASGTDDVQVKAEQKQDNDVVQLNTIVVTATDDEEKPIGKVTSGVNKEDIERRGATNVADLLDQISGVSLNGLYARPDVSVSVQGIGGHGRVSQSLEGITQNFEAFGNNFNQSGTILIDPAFLRSIDVTKGATSDANSIGNLAGTANFNYVGVDDVLFPDQNIGGLFRLNSGIGQYSNGQQLGGMGLFAARDDNWELLLGASKSANDNFHMGKNISTDDYLNSSNYQFGGIANKSTLNTDGTIRWSTIQPTFRDNSQWIHRGNGFDGGGVYSANDIAPLDGQIIEGLKEAAKNSVSPGTWRNTDSQIVKFKYRINDQQQIEFFAARTNAEFQTDVELNLAIPHNGSAAFMNPGFYIDTKAESQVYSLKYQGEFSDLFNPEITVFHEGMKRDQSWTPPTDWVPSTYEGDLYSKIEDNSTGIRLSNSSYFSNSYFGKTKLQASLEYKKLGAVLDTVKF